MAGNKPGMEKGDPRAKLIGKKGGDAVKALRGVEYLQEIGKRGGEKTLKEHGIDRLRSIGKKGGEATRNNHSQEYYSRIARGNQGNRKYAPQADAP